MNKNLIKNILELGFVIILFFIILSYTTTSDESMSLKITGKVLFWENATPVANANVAAELYDGNNFLTQGSNTTNSTGHYVIYLNANLQTHRRYLANITATKGSFTSYLRHYFRFGD